MEIEPFLLLQRYRRDRRRLLEFVISSVLQRDSSGDPFDFSTVDLDTLSVDYVLECAQSGGEFDPLEATRRYFEEWNYPVTMNLSSGSSFFLISKPELSGSPPRRAAPQVGFLVKSNHLYTTEETTNLVDKEIERSGIDTIAGDFASVSEPCKLVMDANVLTLGLPSLSTGFLKGYLMMICVKQPMRCFLVLWYSLEVGF